jgi:hypothetical protein
MRFRLEEHHRVLVADRRDQQALGVGRRARDHDLEARRVAEVGLARLAVVVAAADAAAVRRPDHHRAGVLAAAAVAHLRGFADDLVEGRVDEVEELDLGDRAHAVDGHADRRRR